VLCFPGCLLGGHKIVQGGRDPRKNKLVFFFVHLFSDFQRMVFIDGFLNLLKELGL
jgi:hypothetical protein